MRNVTLLHGDCVELMKDIPGDSVDMVLCDPPYGIDYQSQRRTKSQRKAKIMNDKRPFTAFIPELRRIVKDTGCVCVCSRDGTCSRSSSTA